MKALFTIPAADLLIAFSAAAMTAAPAAAQTPPLCSDAKNHCIDVTIAGGAIRPVPNVVVSEKNHHIYWQIKTSGYSFPPPAAPQRGIAFKPPSSINDNGHMPANEFPCTRISATLFHCPDANSTHGAVRVYQYFITVLDASGKPAALDPWIVNK
jgi:hypothetical protein